MNGHKKLNDKTRARSNAEKKEQDQNRTVKNKDREEDVTVDDSPTRWR